MYDLNKTVKGKRPTMFNKKQIILHQGNTKRHTDLATRQKIADLGCEILSYPPYSPLTPEYHLFLSLQICFDGKQLKTEADVSQALLRV